MFYETFKLAIQAIKRNALRSFLTLLGVVIGVAAVIAIVTVGNGTTAKVAETMAKLGSNLLSVQPGQMGPGRSNDVKPFNIRDVNMLRSQLRGVRAIAPTSQKSSTIIVGAQNRSVKVMGTDNAYFISKDWDLRQGRKFYDSEIRSGRAVCIIGNTVRKELFGSLPVINSRIRVNKISCDVIGLLEAKGVSGFGQDQDDIVIMPMRTFQRRIAGNTEIGSINISVKDGVDIAKVQTNTERLLRERRNIGPNKDDDFSVTDMKQLAETQTATTSILTVLLGAVAGVSLLVGGIGIMNIMLVSVTERTREIGIRLAIGAQESQVLMQFLVEAIVLSLLGGIIGCILGLLLAAAASSFMNIPFIINYKIILLSFSFSALIGVVFGYFPAQRAARMNPIDALRHE